MTRFVDTDFLPQRGARNLLAGIADPLSRRWRVKTVGGIGFKPHALEIEHTLPNGALLMVHRDGWARLNKAGATITGTQSYAVTVEAAADDGVELFADSEGVVLERDDGSMLSTTVTFRMAEFDPDWTPADLSPAFWLRPSDLSTHIAAPAGELTTDVNRRCSTVAGMESAFGALTIAPAVTPSAGSYPKVELTSQSLCPRTGNRLNFSTPISARTVMFVAHVQRNAGWEGSRVISTASNAIEIEEASREIVISGATGTVRVNARAASSQPAYGMQWAIVVARLDSAATWEAISGNAVHIRDLVVVSGAVSDADAERYEGWVAHEYDLAHLLPRNHPYRYGPPGDATPATEPTPWPPNPIKFGSRTKAGMGGIPVPYLAAQTITAGNSAGHWEIAEGMLRPTAAFDSANPAAGSSYALTISGATVEIDIVADDGRPRLDVADTSELLRAFAEVRSDGGEGVAGASIVARSGRYEGASNYSFGSVVATSLHIRPERPGGVISGPLVMSAGENVTIFDWEAHWRYYRGFDSDAGLVRVLQLANGRIERCTARGWHLDWGIGFGATADNFATRQYRVFNGMLATEIYYSEIYNADVVATAETYWGNLSANCLGDGPSTGATRFVMRDSLFLDNPYVSGQAEGGKHSDMLGQAREEPEEIDIQRNVLVANSPLLAAATAGDGQAQRGLFLESGTAAHTPFQQNGVVARNLIALRIAAAAIDFNPRAQLGLLAQENSITNRSGAGVLAWQGGLNAIGVQSNPTDVAITDANRAAAIALSPLPSDRVTRRADVLAYATPVADGPLDLGGDDSVGAVNLDGTLKAPLAGIPPREPSEVTATASGAGIKVATIATNATPNGTISQRALAYVRERGDGVTEFFRSRHSTVPGNRRAWQWRVAANANGDGLIEEGSWTIVDPYTADTVIPVGGNNSYRVAIQEKNEHGWSPWSEATTTVAVGETPPVFEAAPLLTPTSGGLSVSWDAPLSSGLALTSQRLRYRTTPDGAWTEVLSVTSPATITGLAEVEYEVQVRASSSAGTGTYSPGAFATPAAATSFVLASQPWNYADNTGPASTHAGNIPNISAGAGQIVVLGICYWSSSTISSVSFSRHDGSDAVAGAVIGTPIDVSGGTLASGMRKAVVYAVAPAGGWADVRVSVSFSTTPRMRSVGGAVVLDASAPIGSATVVGNTTWAADPAVTATFVAGDAIAFIRLHFDGVSSVDVTGFDGVQTIDGSKILAIADKTILAGSSTITANATPDSTQSNDPVGLMLLNVPAA